MTETWKQWEGQVVDGKFYLRTYLGGSDDSGVFLAEDGAPQPQKVAIKLVPADPENAEVQLSRWGRAGTLSDPHLIRILHMGDCRIGNQRLLYVVTEYAEENLSQIVPQRPLTTSEALHMLRPVLATLAYLHSKGLVHGHLKPANIMAVDDQLRISSDRVCAVGETRLASSKPDVYDAPETATRGYSTAGDVWSLGVTLAEVLTQELPLWEWKGQDEPVLPESLPAPFPDVVRHCLYRDPQARSKISEIAARLLPGSGVPQVQPIVESEDPSPKPRYTVSAALVMLALIMLALIVAGARLVHRRVGAQPAPVDAVSQPTPEASPVGQPQTVPEKAPTEEPPPDRPISGGADSSPAATQAESPALTSPADIVKGEVAQRVLPEVPQKARDTIRGTLRNSVRVRVDPEGAVVEATADAPGPSRYFATLAINTARGWKFTPAKVGGQNVASEWILRFEFAQYGTKVTPEQVAP
jgi:serine/threonine protein kinase